MLYIAKGCGIYKLVMRSST